MDILLISNQHPNSQGVGNPVVLRMVKSLKRDERVRAVEFFPFYNNLESIRTVRRKAKNFDLVHVHFGGIYALILWFVLSGLRCPKIITFHGTDIHAGAVTTETSLMKRIKIRLNQKASFLCIRLYDRCGFVSEAMIEYVPDALSSLLRTKSFIQKLGIDYCAFKPMEKDESMSILGLDKSKRYALFSDVSHTRIKRRDIAEAIVTELGGDYLLLVMSGVKPDVVPVYINASDFLLLTSDEEGSPNIVREALSLNKPVFSVDVGDVKEQIKGLENSSLVSRDPIAAAAMINSILKKQYTDNTRERFRYKLNDTELARQLVDMYQHLLGDNKL